MIMIMTMIMIIIIMIMVIKIIKNRILGFQLKMVLFQDVLSALLLAQLLL